MTTALAPLPLVPVSRVLVATDFSLNAARAVTRAVQLPLAPGAELLLVHVLPSEAPGRFGERLERVTRTALRKEEERMRRIAAEAGREDLVIHSELFHGDPVEAMAKLCGADRMELVVLGRHGKRTIRDQLLGTTAEKLLRASCAPVLVVGQAKPGPWTRPLFAADLRPENALALQTLLRLTAPETDVKVVHAYGPARDAVLRGRPDLEELRAHVRGSLAQVEAALREFVRPLDDGRARFRLLLDAREPKTAIAAAVESWGADLVVLGTQGRTGARRLLLGSVAEDALRTVPCDVLVVRTPEPALSDGAQEPLRMSVPLDERGGDLTAAQLDELRASWGRLPGTWLI